MCDSGPVGSTAFAAAAGATAVVALAALAGPLVSGPAPAARASECNDPFCTPGIAGGVVLGAPCQDTAYYVFGTTSWGRVVFCGSPRRYAPRYFRSPPMMGVKDLNSSCSGSENSVAQAPDGLFLTCAFENQQALWLPGYGRTTPVTTGAVSTTLP